MAIHNADIAAVFDEIADILEIEGANPYRIRAYRNAARTVESFDKDIAGLLGAGGQLPKLPGIGEDLAGKISEIATTGRSALLDRLRTEVPPAIVRLLAIAGLGPRRVKRLYHDLGIETAEQLCQAAQEGRIRRLHGFGKKTEEKLLNSVRAHLADGRRVSIADAAPIAEDLVRYLRKLRGMSEVTVAGSFRRMRETVGDLDILVIAGESGPVVERFTAFPDVAEVLAKGPTRASVVLKSGLQVDLRVMEKADYGAALMYFTGSKAHSIALRQRAQKKGLKVSEYGVFRGKKRIAGATEASMYGALDLPLIPPELRENRGEIEAAARNSLPQLIELGDLKGDLHAHTRATDGRNSIREMALAARDSGLEYLAITDHSRHLTVAHGLDARRLQEQIEEIDRLNGSLHGIVILKGIEVDILEDGRLDLPDELLSQLDLVVGAVHGHFDLPRRKQTRRILRAMEHRYFTVLAHPTCRLIGERTACDIDMPAVIAEAKQRGCYLELNAQPQRLDLSDLDVRQARDHGVGIAINSDAHATGDFAKLCYGIGQARRGWVGKKDVLNARPLSKLRPLLKACFR